MKNKSYRFAILFIAFSTIALGITYLLTHPNPSQPLPQTQETISPTLLPTFTPRPTSTPIVPPSQSQIPGDRYYFYGDWESAINAYNETLDTTNSRDEKSRSLLGLGKTHFQQENYSQALRWLQNLITSYPNSPYLPEAQFFLAETFLKLGQNIEAAEAYAAYLDLRPGVIDAYIQEKRGNALSAAGQYVPAIEAYQAAIAAPGGSEKTNLKLKIGQSYQALGDHDSALVGGL